MNIFKQLNAVIISVSIIIASFPVHAGGQRSLAPPAVHEDVARTMRTPDHAAASAGMDERFLSARIPSIKAFAFDGGALYEPGASYLLSDRTKKNIAELLQSGRHVIVFVSSAEEELQSWSDQILRDLRLVTPEKRPFFYAVEALENGSTAIYQGHVEHGLLTNKVELVVFNDSANKLRFAKRNVVKYMLQKLSIAPAEMFYAGHEKQHQLSHVVNAVEKGQEEVKDFLDKVTTLIRTNAETQDRWNNWWADLKKKAPKVISSTLNTLYNKAVDDCENGAEGRYAVPVWALPYLRGSKGFAYVKKMLDAFPKKFRTPCAEFLQTRNVHVVFELFLKTKKGSAEPEVKYRGFVLAPEYKNTRYFALYGGTTDSKPITPGDSLPMVRDDIQLDDIFGENGFIEPENQLMSLLKLGYYFGPLQDAYVEDIYALERQPSHAKNFLRNFMIVAVPSYIILLVAGYILGARLDPQIELRYKNFNVAFITILYWSIAAVYLLLVKIFIFNKVDIKKHPENNEAAAPVAIKVLVDGALHHADEQQRAQAVEFLKSHGSIHEAVEMLLAAANSVEEEISLRAIKVLEKFDDPSAVNAFIAVSERILQSTPEDTLLVEEVTGALGRLNDPRAMKILRKVNLSDRSIFIRHQALKALLRNDKITQPSTKHAPPENLPHSL